MTCDCCDNALEHRVAYILAHEAHAPIGKTLPRTAILSELEDAMDEYRQQRDERIAAQRAIRDLSAQRRA